MEAQSLVGSHVSASKVLQFEVSPTQVAAATSAWPSAALLRFDGLSVPSRSLARRSGPFRGGLVSHGAP
jgi:hypothetical protein